MLSDKNLKKIAVIASIAIIFIIFVLIAIFKKPEEEVVPDVPIGGHGQADSEKPDVIETYFEIDEKEIELSVESEELLKIIRNPSLELKNLGDYYIYDGYNVFANRNIKIKKSYNKVLSIVFFNEYNHNIVNGLSVKSGKADILNKLGLPNYNENDLMVYKTKDYYIIFNNKLNETSVYFKAKEDLEVFWSFYKMYLDTKNLKGFISNLTNTYPAYTEYRYDTDGLELFYSDLGIRLYFKEGDNENGIYLYSNYSDNGVEEYSIEKLKNLAGVNYEKSNLLTREETERTIKETKKKELSLPEKVYTDYSIYSNLNILDSYRNRKIDPENNKEYKIYKELSNYRIYFERNSSSYTFTNVSIISKKDSKNYNINTAKVADNLLLTENYVFYSIKNEGVFRVNINTGKTIRLFSGEGKFELKYIKENDLYYDDSKIKAI